MKIGGVVFLVFFSPFLQTKKNNNDKCDKMRAFQSIFFDMIFDQIDNIDSIMTMFSWRRRQKFGVQIWLKNY
jgi:hypothetical protein